MSAVNSLVGAARLPAQMPLLKMGHELDVDLMFPAPTFERRPRTIPAGSHICDQLCECRL
jgi:hypothetical protein